MPRGSGEGILYETTDLLKKGDPGLKVLAIGPAGENLVRFAAIGNDKGHFVGRTGLGAVMGAKRLKAICVRGTGKLEKADETRYREIHKAALLEIKESALAGSLRAMGSDANMDIGMINGDVPVKNWTVGEDFELSGGAERSDTLRNLSHPRPRLRPLPGGLQAGRQGAGRPLSGRRRGRGRSTRPAPPSGR